MLDAQIYFIARNKRKVADFGSFVRDKDKLNVNKCYKRYFCCDSQNIFLQTKQHLIQHLIDSRIKNTCIQ